eukprot:gene13828-13943_t
MITKRRIESALTRIKCEAAPLWKNGTVASYIPELGRIKPYQFGLAIATVQGQRYEIGDCRTPFSIQSISKLFALALLVRIAGPDAWSMIGRDSTHVGFNSLDWLESAKGRPFNPFINAGALLVTDLINQRMAHGLIGILRFVRDISGNQDVDIDTAVSASERGTCNKNAAIAYLLRDYGTIQSEVDALLDIYCQQCAIAMSSVDLAAAGLIFANNGMDYLGRNLLTPADTNRINALLTIAGMYNAAGDFAFRVGLPAKSGVGGGILAIVPGKMTVAVWSPPLDVEGNSLAGQKALEILSEELDLSIFSPKRD